MGVIIHRQRAIRTYLSERLAHGLPEREGPLEDEVVFLLGGIGGTQFGPVMWRRALRELGWPVGSVLFNWHRGLWGESLSDLLWLRRNRFMARRLARRILAHRRDHPRCRVHILSFSGGTAIAVFALEVLSGRPAVDTLVLVGSAIRPDYNLAPALKSVQRAYALMSERDRYILGLGTRLLGTMDRTHCASAGLVGFAMPREASPEDRSLYERLVQLQWSPALKGLGHYGGHTGWLAPEFLKEHLLPLLRGRPCWPGDRARKTNFAGSSGGAYKQNDHGKPDRA